GFSGTVLAIRLLERARTGDGVTVIDPAPTPGSGVAYSTVDPDHLLNVRAGGMSAFPERPADFTDWLAATGATADPAAFLPRAVYGAYVAARLREAVAASAGTFRHLRARADAVRLQPGGVIVEAGGERVAADSAVLAFGNLP